MTVTSDRKNIVQKDAMKAYKFRGIESLQFVFDIIVNKRLYCGSVAQLNDVREANTQMGLAPGRERELIEFSSETYKKLNNL